MLCTIGLINEISMQILSRTKTTYSNVRHTYFCEVDLFDRRINPNESYELLNFFREKVASHENNYLECFRMLQQCERRLDFIIAKHMQIV